MRVYQNKNDTNMYVGCNPKSHPTKRYIAAHKEKYTLSHQALPLKPVKAGGGHCKGSEDCGQGGQGKCSGYGRCQCEGDWTGPHCLVREYICSYNYNVKVVIVVVVVLLLW